LLELKTSAKSTRQLADSSLLLKMSRGGICELLQCRFKDSGMYKWRKYMLWTPQDTQKPPLGAVSMHGHVANEHNHLLTAVLPVAHLSRIRMSTSLS
jgi:hypothetical protein